MKITLREVGRGEISRLEEWLDGEELSFYMSGWTPKSVRDGDWNPDRCRWEYIVVDGERAGMVWLERRSLEDDRVGDLGIFISDPELRGQGIGRRVIELIEEDGVRRWGIERVQLRVRKGNAQAIACYERAGYRSKGTSLKEVDGVDIEVLNMEHHLTELERR